MKYALLVTLLGFIFFTCLANHGKDASHPNSLANQVNSNLNDKIMGSNNEDKNWLKYFHGNSL